VLLSGEGADPEHQTVTDRYSAQWRNMLWSHPVAYLKARFELHLRQVGLSGDINSTYFGRSDTLGRDSYEFAPAFPWLLDIRNRALATTADESGKGSILHVPALYLILATVAIVYFGRELRDVRAALFYGAVLGAMQLLLFFAAPTNEYRFQFFQVVLAVALALIAIADYAGRRNGATTLVGGSARAELRRTSER
jgi:hypothetical protein